MIKKIQDLCDELKADIQRVYEESVTIPDAEKLAAKFLGAQMDLASALRNTDLDSKMRKSGLKAIKAAVYMEAATKTDKKPSDVMLDHIINLDSVVAGEQLRLDESEVDRDELQNYLNIAKDGHLYFRAISKGRFE